mgnify:CR=1 FL=1
MIVSSLYTIGNNFAIAISTMACAIFNPMPESFAPRSWKVFSIAFALLDRPVADARSVIKRIWTSPRFNTAAPGDERLPLWHLPAEKRYGLADLYRALAGRGFPTAMPGDAFRVLAGRLCAVPTKSAGKLLRDGVRQLAAKLGLRT